MREALPPPFDPCALGYPRVTDDWLESTIVKIQKKVTKLNLEHPDLAGDGTIFALCRLERWNYRGQTKTPVLSSSKLVTDSIWAHQRHNYGYRDLRSFSNTVWVTCISMSGTNSFIPDDLSDARRNCPIIISNNFDMNLRTTTRSSSDFFTCAYPGYTQHSSVSPSTILPIMRSICSSSAFFV